MTLGGEVDHRRRPLLGEDPAHRVAVGDVAADEGESGGEAGIALHLPQARQVAGVGELVQHHHAVAGLGQRGVDEVGADEPGAAGDEQGLHGLLRASTQGFGGPPFGGGGPRPGGV